MQLDIQGCKEMMLYVADGIISQENMLCEADRMGDADHGTGMANGFKKAKDTISGKEYTSLDELFKDCGMGIMMSSGGASGAIFGTLFREGGKMLAGKDTLTSQDFSAFLEAGLNGIMKRGGAKQGDKTMIDALMPAVETSKKFSKEPLVKHIEGAYEAARKGSEATKEMVAKSGRMRYMKERTKGFADPGSISMYLILQYMRDYLKEHS